MGKGLFSFDSKFSGTPVQLNLWKDYMWAGICVISDDARVGELSRVRPLEVLGCSIGRANLHMSKAR